MRSQVADALERLQSTGFIVDGRTRPRELLAELFRVAPITETELYDIYRQPAWQDPRADTSRARVGAGGGAIRTPLPRRRLCSMPGLDDSPPPPPLAPNEVAALAGPVYGSEVDRKPVASAAAFGRLCSTRSCPDPIAISSIGLIQQVRTWLAYARPSAGQPWTSCSCQATAHLRSSHACEWSSFSLPTYRESGASTATAERSSHPSKLGRRPINSLSSPIRPEIGARTIGGIRPRNLRALVGDTLEPLLVVLLERPSAGPVTV